MRKEVIRTKIVSCISSRIIDESEEENETLKDLIFKIFPWIYPDSKKFWGDTWWFEDEEILASFSDQAVTALGLYYKWQTFFLFRWERYRYALSLLLVITMRQPDWTDAKRPYRRHLFGA